MAEHTNKLSSSDDEKVLLHGVLDITLFEANHLHGALHNIYLEIKEKIGEALLSKEEDHPKLYVTVEIYETTIARSREVPFHSNNKNPKWNESFRIYSAFSSSWIVIAVKKQHHVGATILAHVDIPTSKLIDGEPVQGWFDLLDKHGQSFHGAQLHVLLKFSHVSADPCWNSGIKPQYFRGLSNAFFPQRNGCNVTLFQNSHLSNHFRPVIPLANGTNYHPPRLWEDLYVAITEAKYFIYVVGWSVNTSITLVRDTKRMIPGAEGVSIGELLKKKADEGVIVLVMVWKDRTAVSHIDNAGLMKTHDEETFNFFKGSKVKCFLCPRKVDPSLTAVQHFEIGTEFTHHQKTVTLDAPSCRDGGITRDIVSFIGGIDICDGRYDDEYHTLFRNLDTIYRNDFQQKNFSHADLQHGGPREPWHDAHSKLEGLAAWDVLANFEQRWLKQSPEELHECLFHVTMHTNVFPRPSEDCQAEESWNVQVFRSIDDASVIGFPSDSSEANKMGLIKGKNVTMEQSIHSGYVEAIRRAKRFIYIENQYFFGSCSSWKEDQDSGCSNLIPIEIALKIASKIRQGERFSVYVVTPMWPEGQPEGETVQAILHWNRLTMEMMYGIIAEAIQDAGLSGEVHPCDYLNFFCLANREVHHQNEYVPPERPDFNTNYWLAQHNRRFLIYVHAKLMIVDDEYVIIGSANLNQRSLEGDRDSEIAHGSYQPLHLNGPHGYAKGTIFGYRMSLWYEHFISHHPHLMSNFVAPESLKCVRMVKKIAEQIWNEFVSDEVVDLPGHLLPFPIRVSETGELWDLPENGLFPDTKALVRGKKSQLLPALLTT